MSYLSVRCIAIFMGFYLIQPIDAFAVPQDAIPVAESVAANESQGERTAQYLITLSEYRLTGVDASKMTADGIAAAIKTKNAAPVETIMLSATDGTESRVSFGRQVTVTTGRQSARGGTSRSKEYRDLGTILSVTPTAAGQQVGLGLSFKSTRNVGEGAEDSPPDITATSIDINRVFELGKPTLIGATTAGETIYVFLTVSRQ